MISVGYLMRDRKAITGIELRQILNFEKGETVLKRLNKDFFLWLLLLIIFSIPLLEVHIYSEEDLQYISIENADIQYQRGSKHYPPLAIINDVYYLPLERGIKNNAHNEYENLKAIAKAETITIGFVDDLGFQIYNLNPDCKYVVSLTSESSKTYTLERYNNRERKFLIAFIIIISVYLLLSLAYILIMYLLGERKLRKRLRRRRKKKKLQKKVGKK